jgi:thioester reductase-like protein
MKILLEAAKKGLKTCSLRVGQISGGHANGAWAMNEWIPIMIKSSVTLGCLPEERGVRSVISAYRFSDYV